MSVLSVAAASANGLALSPQGGMDSTLSIQLFMLVLAIPILSLSVLVEQQRGTEESLRESEERFRNMADTAPVMIWVSGRDKLCTFVNAAWLAFTGRTIDQERGDGWAQGVHPADVDRCIAVYHSSFDARRHFRMEYRVRRADGEYRWLLDNGVPRFERGGFFAGYIGSCVDITDLKRTQEEALARQKLESLGVMTGGVAHDFNNLLGSILSLAELAETELAGGSSPEEEIGRIKAVAIRASEIVRELMVYSGQDKASLEPVDVSRLVEDLLELFKISISKHARLQIDLQKDLPYVLGSAPQIRQIVMNLIINASEAIGETDGVIRVSTSCIPVGQAFEPNNAPPLPPGDYLRLQISDTGCGMSEETKARVFDPFFTTKFTGRGMGLAVVQGLVRDHGGGILLASAPGEGTLFEIFLPCLNQTTRTGPDILARAAGEPLRPASATVLIVEDEIILRNSLSRILRIRGHAVLEAGDGTTAIDLIRAHTGDLDAMLLDVTLPGISSREVFEEARHRRPDLKIILTSAYSREATNVSFAGLRIGHFIRKPFQLEDLLDLLKDDLTRGAGA
jgi:PAS domain S-box-containing protein